MNDDFRAVPTSVGGLLGGAGGYALARMTDMGGTGEALMSAAGAALGGGLGYLRGKAMRDREISAAELLEAREILRKKNNRDRAIAATATAGVGAGITALGAPALARRHHKEFMSNTTKAHKEWGAQVRALVAADELSELNSRTGKYGVGLLGRDLSERGLPYRMWKDQVRAKAMERLNKQYGGLAEKLLRDNPGVLTEADLTVPGVPYRMWENKVKAEANKRLHEYIKEVDKQIIKNKGIIPSGLYVPDPGTPAYKKMYAERLRQAKKDLEAIKPAKTAAYIPGKNSAEWRSTLAKHLKDVRREMAADKPLSSASFMTNPVDLNTRGSVARALKARRLRAARTKLGATKPKATKLPKLMGSLRGRRGLYTGLGLAATAGLAGLASWLTKDNSVQ